MGHTVVHLLGSVQDFVKVPPELWAMARELDRHYIQPRYPNSFATGYPGEFYDQEIAGRCLEYAERILRFVEENLS